MTATSSPQLATPATLAEMTGFVMHVLYPALGEDASPGRPSAGRSMVTVVGIIDDRDAGDDRNAPSHTLIKPLPRRGRSHQPGNILAPAMFLRIRTMGRDVLYTLEPATEPGEPRGWYVASGSYAHGYGEDLKSLMPGVSYVAIAIHDRREW